ncbi:MAG: hypothetical protein AB7T49_12470 [Oligoflexales bacterium]
MNWFAKNSVRKDEQYFNNLFDPSVVNQFDNFEPSKSKVWRFRLAAAMVVVAGAIFFVFTHSWAKPEAFAFVDLKAITQSGHPVAGAEVFLDDKTMGFTDSFGEWRKFVSVRAEQKLHFVFAKTTESESFAGEKTIMVAASHQKGREAEVKSTVQLRTQGEPVKSEPQNTSKTITLNPWSRFSLAFGVGVAPDLKVALSDHLQALGLTIGSKGTVKITIDQLMPRHHKLLRLKVEDMKSGMPARTVLIRTVGLAANNVDEIIELSKMLVPYPFEFVYSEGRWILDEATPAFWLPSGKVALQSQKLKEFEVGRGSGGKYEISSLETSGDPCDRSERCRLTAPALSDVPPHSSFKPMRVQVLGRIPRESEIYVSGYRANHVEPSFWEYWGKNGEDSLVTVVRDRLIVQREKIHNSLTRPPKLVLKEPRIAKN